MKKILKITKTILKVLGIIILLAISGLLIYSSNFYKSSEEMESAIVSLNYDSVTVSEDSISIKYIVENPLRNIIIIPGGKVEANSYEYLAKQLASFGNQVVIYKPILNLAIILPNRVLKLLDENLDNIIIGHSLGGVVASMISSSNSKVSKVILLASYPTQDLLGKEVLLITAENDLLLDKEEYQNSLNKLDSYEEYNIEGGNHAQFGWYGEQDKDGLASISTKTQQDLVISKIIEFINN